MAENRISYKQYKEEIGITNELKKKVDVKERKKQSIKNLEFILKGRELSNE